MTAEAIDSTASAAASAAGARSGSRWAGARSLARLACRNLLRQRSRTLLLGGLVLFSSLVIVYFSQFLAGVQLNYSRNLAALATGDVYFASRVTREIDRSIFDREYRYFRFDAALQSELARLPGVQAATVRLEFDTKVATDIDSLPFRAMAFDPRADAALARNFRLVEGRLFQPGAYEIVVPVEFARRNQIRVGDSIRLVAKALNKKINLIDYRVTGLFSAISLPAWFDNYVYIDLAAARVLVDDPAGATRVNLALQPGADAEATRAALDALLQRRAAAQQQQPAEERDPELQALHWHDGAEVFEELVGAMQLSYAIVIAIVTVMVGASLAFTTMLNIVERTRELATLAALGATPGRIRALLVGESLVLGLAASLAGTALAALLFAVTARVGIPITSKELGGFLGASRFHPAFDAGGFVAGLAVPLLVALLASWFFARRAARLPIAQALAER